MSVTRERTPDETSWRLYDQSLKRLECKHRDAQFICPLNPQWFQPWQKEEVFFLQNSLLTGERMCGRSSAPESATRPPPGVVISSESGGMPVCFDAWGREAVKWPRWGSHEPNGGSAAKGAGAVLRSVAVKVKSLWAPETCYCCSKHIYGVFAWPRRSRREGRRGPWKRERSRSKLISKTLRIPFRKIRARACCSLNWGW